MDWDSNEGKAIKAQDVSFSSEIGVMVSLEAEVPEALYIGMKDFICSNPQWDQYQLMSSALANFLYQNGCSDRAVIDKYLSDLFKVSES
mgnify:CR=1 FL=1